MNNEKLSREISPLGYGVGQLLNRMVVHSLAPRIRFAGRQHLPARGPLILVSNHLSHVDSALIAAAVHRRLSFMAMSELFTMPLWGKLARWCGAFPVERGTADRKALAHSSQLLAAGRALVVYPEGCLAKDGRLGSILPGAAVLALRSGVPLLPVGIYNSVALMPYGPSCPRPTLAPIGVFFGQQVELADLAALPGKTAREVATARMDAGIRAAVEAAACAALDGHARHKYAGRMTGQAAVTLTTSPRSEVRP